LRREYLGFHVAAGMHLCITLSYLMHIAPSS
jgi:hypothetical protein